VLHASVRDDLIILLRRLASRDQVRSEATVQADIRQFLLTSGLNLSDHHLSVDLETKVGELSRIDIEVGSTVIEVKRDLRKPGVIEAAKVQLQGYLDGRTKQTNRRYVGILSDGAEWRTYQLVEGGLVSRDSIGFTWRCCPATF
jgi:hypothetical protein